METNSTETPLREYTLSGIKKLITIGGSRGITIPSSWLKLMNIHTGDEFKFIVNSKEIKLIKITREEVLEQIKKGSLYD